MDSDVVEITVEFVHVRFSDGVLIDVIPALLVKVMLPEMYLVKFKSFVHGIKAISNVGGLLTIISPSGVLVDDVVGDVVDDVVDVDDVDDDVDGNAVCGIGSYNVWRIVTSFVLGTYV